MKQQREFCYIPRYCVHCHQEIPLKPKRLYQYERRGYPAYIQGHQHFGNNNVMKRPEVKAKIIGRKRPDFSEFNKTRTGSKNPNFGNHNLFSQKHKERISEGLKKYHQKQEPVKPKIEPIVEIPQSIPEIKPVLPYEEQLKIALKRVQQNRENNLKERKSEPVIIKSEEDSVYSNRISELVKKFGDPEKKEKHYIKP